MNNVTKLMVVLSFVAPAFAGKTTDFLNVIDPRTITTSFENKEYGYTAAKAGVVAAGVAAAGTTLWALNKYVPAFNKHVTQNVKAAAKGYVARMRQLDPSTVAFTAAALGLVVAGYKIHKTNQALAAAQAVPSRDGFFADLAATEFAAKKFAALEKAVADAKQDVVDNKDATRKDALDKAVVDAEKALADAQKAAKDGSQAAAAGKMFAENKGDVAALKAAFVQTANNFDAFKAYNA